MKTVPHVVEEKHLKLFQHDNSIKQARTVQTKRKPRKQTKPKKKVQRKTKKSMKGRVTKKRPQLKPRRRRGNIKDIFSP